MTREERKTFNQMKKLDVNGLVNISIPVDYSHEAKQAIHEQLTVVKGLIASKVCWNDILECYGILYVPATSTEERQRQETADVDDIIKRLPTSDYTWNGYKKPEQKEQKERKEQIAATEKRLATMRANLDKLETTADAILKKGDATTAAERALLLSMVNVAYHSSGKIEGIYSVDSCAACGFCQKMIRAAGNNSLIICGSCYAAADSWKEAAWRRHKLNARILSTVLFTREELATLAIGALCRFNEDGDTVNQTMGQNYLRIAFSHPATQFGYWFKNAPAVEKALHAEGVRAREDLPDNVRFIHSSIMIGIEARPLWFDDAIFTVYPDEATTGAAIAAGAHECNGRRCRACGFNCYLMKRRNADPLRIAELLRCNKARRAAILGALEDWKARRG